MKIALVYFTYNKNEKLLFESIEAAKYLNDNNDYDIFVIDDSNNPMSKIPESCIYEQSYWDRGGNLKTLANLIESVKLYDRIINSGYEWVVKVDPDTWINSFDFLKEGDSELYGKAGFSTNGVHSHGFVECFSAKGIKALLATVCGKHALSLAE